MPLYALPGNCQLHCFFKTGAQNVLCFVATVVLIDFCEEILQPQAERWTTVPSVNTCVKLHEVLFSNVLDKAFPSVGIL